MEESARKGTVTSLSSMFPAQDAKNAAKRVQDTLVEKEQELNQVKEFISDNANLINLVQKLPEELHHDIMVPFGKAAFFPGRLIHTNEFLVLLGEGYFVERTSKQTVEILNRRGKALESQVSSLKAAMQNLQVEASFFDATASEAAEGLVEIREEYVEESSSGPSKEDLPSISKGDNEKVEDEEYERIMSRLDELEMEEHAAEDDGGNDENKQTNAAKSNYENDGGQANQFQDQTTLDNNHKVLEEINSRKSPQKTINKIATTEEFSNESQEFSEYSCTGLKMDAISTDATMYGKSLAGSKNASVLAQGKEMVGAVPPSRMEVSAQTLEPGSDSQKASTPVPKPVFEPEKAFTGSVIERPLNLQPQRVGNSSKPSDGQPTKPVSRFKMQRK